MTEGRGEGMGFQGRDWFGLPDFMPGERFLRDGATVFLLDEVGSTNEFLRGKGDPAWGRLCVWDGWGWQAQARVLLAPVTDPGPGTVAVARRQTAGRGRQGRNWFDCGGLNLSVIVPPHRVSLDLGFSVWLGLMAVLVLRDGFQVDARLKWPNDIVVHGRKLGGILLQRQTLGDHSLTVAGLGVNLDARTVDFPDSLQGFATSLLIETGATIKPGALAGSLLRRVESELDRFQESGWAPFRPALALLDCLLGRRIRLVSVGREYRGRAVGIDDNGALRLEEDDGSLVSLQVGDAHLLHSEDN